MPTPKELEDKFWKALESDRTLMLGLLKAEEGHTRPMTAMFERRGGPMWFFTVKENAMVSHLGTNQPSGARAVATFTAKGHDLFAAIHGNLAVDTDPAVIDRLWNSHVAAWYKGGKTDPSLALLRLDADQAEIWENASSIMAGIKLMFGADPKEEFKDKVANVDLRR